MPEHEQSEAKPDHADKAAEQVTGRAGVGHEPPIRRGLDDGSGRTMPLARRTALRLQRQVGNASLGRYLQRTVIQRWAPDSKLGQLAEELDSFDVDEGRVLTLIRSMDAGERSSVIGHFRGELADCLNVGEMVAAVTALRAPLETQLRWVQSAATLGSTGLDYSDIRGLVTAATPGERAALVSSTWKTFFVEVCTNATIVQAVTDLDFMLVTQLDWIKEEADPSRLDYAELKPLITRASAAADRGSLATTSWRTFFVGVCTNATIVEAVTDLGFDLVTQLEWIREEADPRTLDYESIQPLVTRPEAEADRARLKTAAWQGFFVGVCTNANILTALQDLGFDLATQLTWLQDEASPLLSLDLDTLRPLLASRSEVELAAASTDAWLPFWSAVCTNETMVELVQILFPTDLVKQMHFIADEGSSADLVVARIEAFTEPERVALYDQTDVMAMIAGWSGPDRGKVVKAIGGPPAKQLTALGATFSVTLIDWATPSQDWVDAVVAARPDEPLASLLLARDDLTWAPFIRPKLADLFRGNDATVYGQNMVALTWAAYGTGSTFNAADTLVVFRSLFGRTLTTAGEDVIFTTSDTERLRYPAVASDDPSARELMMTVKPIPRSQVAISEITFASQEFKETKDASGAWSGTGTSFTSFFWRNRIVIGVSATGGMSSTPVGTTALGEASAFGAAGTAGPGGTTRTTTTALTYFQNHVRHEIGHAVGQAAVGDMSESGDTVANKWGDWKASTKNSFLGAMWSAVPRPATGWPSLDVGGGAVTLTDTQVRDWLVGLLEQGVEVAGPIKNGTKTIPQKLATIASSIWAGQDLLTYVQSIRATTPTAIQDGAYEFPGYTPHNPVHIFSTRESNRFMTYDKGAYDKLHTSTGWYSLSSHKEMFAEIYTRRYSDSGTPGPQNGKNWNDFFNTLEAQDDPRFGAPEPDPAPMLP